MKKFTDYLDEALMDSDRKMMHLAHLRGGLESVSKRLRLLLTTSRNLESIRAELMQVADSLESIDANAEKYANSPEQG